MNQLVSALSASALLENWAQWPHQCPTEITGLSLDSRLTQPGDLFLACSGPISQRVDYIEQAIALGAAGVLRSTDGDIAETTFIRANDKLIPLLTIPKLEEKVGWIAAKFYEDPSAQMILIGITGTNGKTSTTHFIANSLQTAGWPCGIIGTLGFGFPDHLQAG